MQCLEKKVSLFNQNWHSIWQNSRAARTILTYWMNWNTWSFKISNFLLMFLLKIIIWFMIVVSTNNLHIWEVSQRFTFNSSKWKRYLNFDDFWVLFFKKLNSELIIVVNLYVSLLSKFLDPVSVCIRKKQKSAISSHEIRQKLKLNVPESRRGFVTSPLQCYV